VLAVLDPTEGRFLMGLQPPTTQARLQGVAAPVLLRPVPAAMEPCLEATLMDLVLIWVVLAVLDPTGGP